MGWLIVDVNWARLGPQQEKAAVAADGAAPEIKHDFPVLLSLKND